jgi:nicotinamide mononucleotide (NMN) deamidase PncC
LENAAMIGGETSGKPVGLVYFAVDDGQSVVVDRMQFAGDRPKVKRSSAEHLIWMIAKSLK